MLLQNLSYTYKYISSCNMISLTLKYMILHGSLHNNKLITFSSMWILYVYLNWIYMLFYIDHPLFMCVAFGYRNVIPVYVPENVSAGGISKWKLSIESLLIISSKFYISTYEYISDIYTDELYIRYNLFT